MTGPLLEVLEIAVVWLLAVKETASFRLRTILTLVGLAVGLFALSAMGSMALHFHRLAARFDAVLTGKIFIREKSGFFGAGALSEDEILSLRKNAQIADAIPVLAARLRAREFIVLGFPQTVLGIPPGERPNLLGGVDLLDGHWPVRSDECVLGIDLAPQRAGSALGHITYQDKTLSVSGIMARTNGPEDREMIVSLPVLEALLGRKGLVSYGIVIPAKTASLEALAGEIAATHQTWDVLPPAFLKEEAKKSELLWDALTFGIGLMAALIGGLGILTVMMMSVSERTPEIAVAKALGASRGQIFSLFMMESLMLSGAGAVIGFSFSLWFIHGANAFLAQRGIVLFEPSGWLFLLSGGCALVLALLGGVYPAAAASRIRPAEALRR